MENNLPLIFIIFFQILKALATKKKRPVALVKAITFHLTLRKDINDLKMVSDALYSAASLSIKDPDFIESLLIHGLTVLKQNHESKIEISAVLRSIVNSLGQLKFYHAEFMDEISSWYCQKIKDGTKLHHKDLLAFLMTTATINYCPKDSDTIYEVHNCLKKFRDLFYCIS